MENPNQKWMRTGDWGYPYFRKPPYLSKKHVHPSRPHGLGLTPRPQYAMMQRPDSVKKEWLNGQSTGKSNGHLCPWSNPSEKCGSNKSNGDWIDWMEHRTIYIYMFFLLFFKHFVTIQIPGGPVNFPFPGTIPSSPKTSCWKHARDECHPDPLSAEAANLPRWKVVDGQYVPLKWGSPRSYSPRWSHRSHNYHIFFQIFEGLNGTYIFIGGFINGESPI